jgi:hypothetical protein
MFTQEFDFNREIMQKKLSKLHMVDLIQAHLTLALSQNTERGNYFR